MNRVTKKQIQDEFAQYDGALNVVEIDPNNPARRGLWCSGLNPHAALREIIESLRKDVKVVVFLTKDLRELVAGESQWDIKRYKEAAAALKIDWHFGRIK